MGSCTTIFMNVITIIVNVFVAIGTIGAVVVALKSIKKADLREVKSTKQKKIEEILFLIADIFNPLDNISKVHQKRFIEMPSYDHNPDLSFDTDIRKVQMNIIHMGALIKAYIGTVEPFKKACLLIAGQDGYFDKRKNFLSREVKEKAGNTGHYAGVSPEELQEKEKLDSDLVCILEKATQLFQDAHYELIEKLKELSK
jgi:hypothetical protein